MFLCTFKLLTASLTVTRQPSGEIDHSDYIDHNDYIDYRTRCFYDL
jgi:hypothetical protein